MPMTALTGSRVRERRLHLGLRQADLARSAGISASYLNLIEHNRRRIGDEVLARLARALGIAAHTLAAGAEGVLIEDLRAAAAGGGDEDQPELDRVEDFVGRFPGWARMMAAQHRRIGLLERTVNALNDRMTHDTHLSEALHEVLSAVSAVRSTAAILAETEDIEPEWRARFHANIHSDSERLAVGAEALVAYLDGSAEDDDTGLSAPQDEVEAWLAERGWHLDELETGEPGVLDPELAQLASAAAREMARGLVAQAARDAQALPLPEFRAAMRAGGDPMLVARRFGVGVLSVFRRIALAPGAQAGLVVCDGSGTLVFRKPPQGFVLPRFGAACPLWPLFEALGRPMRPVEAVVEPAGRGRRRFRARAFCEPRHPEGFSGPELREAGMLIEPIASEPGVEPLSVGTSCRICPRPACPARREPTILIEGS